MSSRLPPLVGERSVNLDEIQAKVDLLQLVERELGISLRRSGKEWRGECPKHASDSKRTLNVNPETGKWTCRSCGAGGDVIRFLEWSREIDFKEALAIVEDLAGVRAVRSSRPAPAADPLATRRPVLKETAAPRPELEEHVARYEAALAGSPGETYLAERGIPLAVAQRYRIGYAAQGEWMHLDDEGRPIRQWRPGRITAPHTDPTAAIVNIYGRAASAVPEKWKEWKHDHLRGKRGLFNAPALVEGDGPLYVCEGVFDALALVAAGLERVIAGFGLDQWPWQWARDVEELVFVLDHDEHGAGQKAARNFARAARLRGRTVWLVPAEAYGGAKDVAEAWQRGTLDLAAVMPPARILEAVEAPIVPESMPEALQPDALEAEALSAAPDPFAAYEAEVLARAVWLVCDELATGSKRIDELVRAGSAIGLPEATILAARDALGVESFTVTTMSGLVRLPPGPCRCRGEEMPPRLS